MSTWQTHKTVSGEPTDVLLALTDPDAIRLWSPIPFDVDEMKDKRLAAGSRAKVRGKLAGKEVSFDVTVSEADPNALRLSATGPIELDVHYRFEAAKGGTDVTASVAVKGRGGLMSGLLSRATDAVLAAGALDMALGRIEAKVAA
jgi:hypothetical protein